MEQKQLDELDESFFGEEYVEDEVDMKPKRKDIPKKEDKKAKAAKTVDKKEEKIPPVEIVDLKEEVTITPATEEKKELANPWAEGDANESSSSLWKAVTGILIVLLIFSILTQGFRFSDAKKEETVPLGTVQSKLMSFINTQLLEPPHVATAKSSQELDSVYKFTIDVAGKSVDSYVTKDGKLFFPQGFALDIPLKLATEEKPAPAKNITPAVPKEAIEKSSASTPAATDVKPPSAESEASEKETVTIVPMRYRKWVFEPNSLEFKKGDVIRLTLYPDTSKSELTLPEFTFSIPALKISKKVTGTTTVELKADAAGTFTFECGDCSGAQKEVMKGTITVK
ncbi:cupredoxin domain-containing protein [Candidatus Woesearchaeota archaeon]|nr:cupredoxin domain-containing protein [Candidatus Woesearchaeota archaeon]